MVCQDGTITAAGRARDDGEINFEITEAMVPHCVLHVFSVSGGAPHTDMVLFFAEPSCKVICTRSDKPGLKEYFSGSALDISLPPP